MNKSMRKSWRIYMKLLQKIVDTLDLIQDCAEKERPFSIELKQEFEWRKSEYVVAIEEIKKILDGGTNIKEIQHE